MNTPQTPNEDTVHQFVVFGCLFRFVLVADWEFAADNVFFFSLSILKREKEKVVALVLIQAYTTRFSVYDLWFDFSIVWPMIWLFLFPWGYSCCSLLYLTSYKNIFILKWKLSHHSQNAFLFLFLFFYEH